LLTFFLTSSAKNIVTSSAVAADKETPFVFPFF